MAEEGLRRPAGHLLDRS